MHELGKYIKRKAKSKYNKKQKSYERQHKPQILDLHLVSFSVFLPVLTLNAGRVSESLDLYPTYTHLLSTLIQTRAFNIPHML